LPEAHAVAGFELAHFPQLAIHDDGGANESAEARSIGTEDYRHVASEIDCADGVGIVMDV
jgi:hypothetical protein